MILRIFLFTLLYFTNLFSLATSSDDEYKIYETPKYTIIYTKANEKEALYIKTNIDNYLKELDKSFGFSFDEPIFISLISPNIELANAFSSQIPYNEALFYGGGVQYIDYFSSKSWLDTLLHHELPHNYQINAKTSVSKDLHRFLGNNYLPVLAGPIPLFTLPNLLIPTALLEGNSVLNESIHHNGGRVYNGRFKALTNLLILHNKMDKTIFINDHIDFPYGEEKYIVGGYYMLYLAHKYGVDKVNNFYKAQSEHFVNPFILNETFKTHFDESFDESFLEFIKDTKEKAKEFKAIEDNSFIATSKKEIYLNKQDEKIYFLTNDNITKPILNTYDSSGKHETNFGNWLNGKVFKIKDKFYSSSQTYIDSTLYKNGLFDEDRFIKKDTTGKVIQDIFEDHEIYFDVSKSFDTPSLYLDGKFYDKPNSSALFDKKGNIYYFKQENDERVLYKSKAKLFSFKGYFSKVVNIVDDTIYFIANTKNGSTLFKYDGEIKRVSEFDNIIDAKILDKNKALIVSINHDNYRIYTMPLKEIAEKVFTTKLDIKEKAPFNSTKIAPNTSMFGRNYNELKELRFSLLYPSYSYSSTDGSLYTLDAYFFDPLMFNMLGLYAYKYEDEKYVGFDYINERYIPFEINFYDSSIDEPSFNDRGYGGFIKLYGPLYQAGSHVLEVELNKYFDDENKEKSPLLFSASHTYNLDYGASFEPYFSSKLETYLKDDRDDFIYGASYDISHHIYKESYIKGSIKTLKSDTNTINTGRGVKVYEDKLTSLDSSDIYAPGIDTDFYVKDITKTSLGISQTINLNKYFFTFPISLRREHIYLDYSGYEYTIDTKHSFNEKTIGITLDTLLAHKISMPIDIKYIKNSSSVDDYKWVFSLGVEF